MNYILLYTEVTQNYVVSTHIILFLQQGLPVCLGQQVLHVLADVGILDLRLPGLDKLHQGIVDENVLVLREGK